MDSFSYCDISSVFTTKTIDRIISPMAVQLCHLIISLECDSNKYTALSGDLEQLAQELSKFTEHFANASLRMGAECDDGILGQEMEKAAQSLLMIGKSILLSVQKLNIQPLIRKHQEELVIAARNILMGTLKILQLEDDAGVRKIHQTADWLLESLTNLQKAESISQLRSHFWEFSEALLLLNNLTKNRILDLKESLHQKHLAQKLQVLHKCVPMLYTATQSSIRHPYNDQIIDSKMYIFDQTSKTVQELKSLLTTDAGRHEVQKQGSFAQELCHLFDILSNPNPIELHNSDFDFLVGAVIFYCMYVADCSRPNIKLQLVKHCQNLLEHRKKLCDHLKELQEGPCGNRIDLEEQCASMRVQLNHINENLISSIFYQILDAFTVRDPLKRLLRSALKINKKASLHSEHLFASKAFQPLLQAFQNHTDQLLKISSLVLAQCSQGQIIEEIQSSVDCLCRVRDEVVALVLDTKKAYYECKMFEKAQSIYHKWIQATESLIMSLDGILTVHQFLELSIREIKENKYHCEKLLRSQEPEIFQHHAADLCDLAERAAQVVTRYVDHSKSPIFRNGLRVLVRQLETSVLETREAMIKCVENISCFTTQNHFLEKVNYLFESIHNVQEGVTGSKHPDLLSPLRNEGGPVTPKVMTVDLNEFEQSKEEDEKKLREQHKSCLSYEEYLSKPVPIVNSEVMIRNRSHVKNEIHVMDFQPLVGDLLSAIKQQDSKEIDACSSLLHEICSIYLEVASDTSLHKNIIEKDELKYKDTEALILNLVQFGGEKNIEPVLEVGRLIKSATLLSRHIEEMKTYLLTLANCWYNFSYKLFCNSKNTKCVASNVEIFNRLMQCFERIVQSIREHLLDNYDVDLKFTDLSGKQDYVVKVHVQFSKCQAASNRLLSEVLCCGAQSENHKLEYVCILWAISVQQLSRTLDEFIGIDNLSISGPTDWTQHNFSESKSLVLLCEISLWLQEAAVLSIHNFKEEKEQKKVLLLKEEMGSLTEAVLKLRDDLNTSTLCDLSFNIDYMLLQMELKLKTKLLMDHIKKLYKTHFDIFSCNSCDRFLAIRSFANNAKSLVNKVTFMKETLESSPCDQNKEELLLLVNHFYSLTNDIAAKARIFMENQYDWDLFILEAMLLKWSAEANQLISHIRSDTELDVSFLEFITQILRFREGTETTMRDPVVLETDTSNVSIQSMNINVVERRADTAYEQRTSGSRDTSNGDKTEAVWKQIAACGDEQSEINSSDKARSESGLITKEQSAIDGTQWTKLSKRHKSTVRRSIKVVPSKQDIATNHKPNKNFTEKQTVDVTTNTESEDSPLNVNMNKDNGKESTNYNLHSDSSVENCLVKQESSKLTLNATVFGAEKERNNQETENLTTSPLFTAVKKRVSRQQTMLHKAHKVLTATPKETLDQELMKEETGEENIRGIFSESTKHHQTNRESSLVQSKGTKQEPKEVVTVHRETQNTITNQKTRDQTIGIATSPGDPINVQKLVKTPKKEAKISICEEWKNNPQDSTIDKIHLENIEQQTKITVQRSTTTKEYITPPRKETLSKQKVIFNSKGQRNMDKEQPKPEIQNNQHISNKSEERKHNEIRQQTKPRTYPISQPGMNILKMNYKKPVAVSLDNLSSTTVIVEHTKVNCSSLEDVRNVGWHSQRYSKCLLAEEVETWEGETNTVVKITREMAAQMSYMIQYLDKKGPIKSPEQFIASAKSIATLGQTFVKFIGIMAKNCADKRNTCELLCGMEQVQTISNQLNIISSVKAATGCDDYSAEDVLLKNAQNLIHSILLTWKAAEAASIKSTENPIYSKEEEEVAAFCSQLRKKLLCQRAKETE
ncbi:uncharacterized protein RB166_005707 [Leptodactylus fuscus]